MSFRARLTLFFVLVVIVPMVSLSFMLLQLIAQNQHGKANARVATRAIGALALQDAAVADAAAAAARIRDDRAFAAAVRAGRRGAVETRAQDLLRDQGALRIVVRRGGRLLADVGSRSAIFPAQRQLVDRGGEELATLEVSTQDPRTFARTLVARDKTVEVVIRRGTGVLAATMPTRGLPVPLPVKRTDVGVGSEEYRVASFDAGDVGRPGGVRVSLLEDLAATHAQTRRAQLYGAALLFGFFGLAFVFAVLVSRSLQRQIAGFLQAARRLGRGDFTAKVPIYGNDELAALGQEFNLMSGQLERRLEELRAEQGRLNQAMRRIGETFASNLDRNALLEIVLRTALDGTGAEGGRAAVRDATGTPSILARVGEADALGTALAAAESESLRGGYPGEANIDGAAALAHPLWSSSDGDGPPRVSGAVSVARRGGRFTEPERELFHYLAGQASVSLENVGLHETVERQAVTDDLTGLSNRRAFDETITTEVERSRRFDQPVSLVMVDIDDFKTVNDRHGHLLGDEVLRRVADVLRASGREIDEPARYGGEELAMVLPGTDLEGAYNLAERIREGIADLRIPLPDGEVLQVTASLGAAVRPGSADDVIGLVRSADQALYEAKRSGKNRTVRASAVASA
jgi:diguanylate cyclase (GGDEF)-like protein